VSGGGSAVRVVRVCTLLVTIHSLLASGLVKDLVHKLTGRRYRDGLYRLAYNVQLAALLAYVALWFLLQPGRELYRLCSPWSWLIRVVQVASLGVMLSTIWVSGRPATEVPQLRAFLTGSEFGTQAEANRMIGQTTRRWDLLARGYSGPALRQPLCRSSGHGSNCSKDVKGRI